MWSNIIADVAANIKKALKETAPSLAPAGGDKDLGLGRVADDATVALGRHLRTLGRNVGDTASPIGIGSAASFSTSHGLETAGKYLENEGFAGAARDLGAKVKENPLPFIAVGVGLGFLIGRLLPTQKR